jgi:transcriptional regulator with XRE-family HTH domain
MRPGMENSVLARRLVRTRLALGYTTQRGFAEQLGIRSHQINVFERGRRRISLGVALLIREKFGISLDWIYCGDAAGLPAALYKKLKRGR